MTSVEWAKIYHFSSNEAWGDADKIEFTLVQKLDQLRSYLNKKMIILSGTQGLHSKNSFHYVGKAVDFCILDKGRLTMLDYFFMIEKFFSRVGIYPYWKLNDTMVGGFHVDIGSPQVPFTSQHWIGLRKRGKDNIYIALTEANLKMCGVL